MNIDRKELKQTAKQIMAQAQPRPIMVTLVYLLICQAVSMAVSAAISISGVTGGILTASAGIFSGGYTGPAPAYTMLGIFLNVLVMLFGAVMQYGYAGYCLRLSDRQETSYGDLFCGFPETGRVVLMNLAVAGFCLVWSLAIAVPAGMLLLLCGLIFSAIPAVGIALLLVIYIGMIALIFFVMVRYALSTLVLADDPNIGPLNAVRRSRALLRGRNMECFVLQLSFLGWGLLCAVIVFAVVGGAVAFTYFVWNTPVAITLGGITAMVLGFLATLPIMVWLQPYIETTVALYYRALSPRNSQSDAQSITPKTPWRPEN